MTISFHNLANENKIVLFYLQRHSINLTQSLNVEVFQPFKYYYTNAIDKSVLLVDEKFGKLEFLSMFLQPNLQTNHHPSCF